MYIHRLTELRMRELMGFTPKPCSFFFGLAAGVRIGLNHLTVIFGLEVVM